MITDDDEHFLEENQQEVDYLKFTVPESQDCIAEDSDIYKQIAEKEHYLVLAAEAGQVLLEKNQQLSQQYHTLQEDYSQKVEELEQQKHYLQRELSERDRNYESRMQDLQQEFSSLSGQLNKVHRSSMHIEKSHQSALEDVTLQNTSLSTELDEMKSYNKELAKHVEALSKRLDERDENPVNIGQARRYSAVVDDTMLRNNNVDYIDYGEMRNLKEQVRKLLEEKLYLESSLLESTREKETLSSEQEKSLMKIAQLEREIHYLQKQMDICQDDLAKLRRKNEKLKDRLEESQFLQQTTTPPRIGSMNKSLFNELEMSLSEADMNFQNVMSTPKKSKIETVEVEDDDLEFDDNEVVSINRRKITDAKNEKLTQEIKRIYTKLSILRGKILCGDTNVLTAEEISEDSILNGGLVTGLVDEIISLIEERVLALGLIDAQTCATSPRPTTPEMDDVSVADSQLSDREVDLLEQQVLELNQRLNHATSESQQAKKELTVVQNKYNAEEESSKALQVKCNSQEREIESLRKERDIMMADKSMEEKLRLVLQERDEASSRENALSGRLEESTLDMQKLNKQLLTAVDQKFTLSEQLEAWQFDMAALIDQQLKTKISKDSEKRNRKRSGSSGFFASKLFRNNKNATNSPKRDKSPNPPAKK